jgi:hypothetical protein
VTELEGKGATLAYLEELSQNVIGGTEATQEKPQVVLQTYPNSKTVPLRTSG